VTLHARVGLRLGALELDVAIQAESGKTVVVLGPNGAGKSTLLRAIAGLVPLETGRIELDGDVLDDPDEGVWVATEDRRIGVVFQDLLLFPHLSAVENIAFGLRAHGVRRGAARVEAHAWLDRLGISDHAASRPTMLSGGQAQKVALARSLALRPRLLLLDEPLAALDVTSRVDVRRELRRQLDGFDGARIVVTHDPVEAVALADQVVVIEGGRVRQAGPVSELRARPRSRYVADFAGVNLYSGVIRGDRLRTDDGNELTVVNDVGIDGPSVAIVHPEAVAVYPSAPIGSPRNTWPGTVGEIDRDGRRVRVRVDAPMPITAEITERAAAELGLRAGSEVWVSVKATEVEIFPV
jgi:molybdate transport system ATP-binding protein